MKYEMKKEDIEKLIRERRTTPPVPPSSRPDSPGPPGSFKSPMLFLGRVNLTDDNSDEADYIATLQLLEDCLEDDIFKCKTCDFSTTDPKDMIEHIAYEINNAFQTVADMYNKPPTPQQQQQSPFNRPGTPPGKGD